MRRSMLILATLAATVARAEDFPTPPDLPPTAVARPLLEHDPDVMAAQAAAALAGTEAAQLRASPHEWSTRLSGQERRYDAGATSTEWSAELQRAFRLPGKAGRDRRIGAAGMAAAAAGVGEATHEAARELVARWLEWLGAVEQRRLSERQQALAAQNLVAVERRLQAGDASRLERGLAQAEQAVARRALSAARTREAAALALLRAHFPGIDSAAPPALAEPQPVSGDLAQWRDRILAHNDPLRIARARLERAREEAGRARAERLPDPTLGVFTASEAQGHENIVGVSVTLPLPGRQRALAATRAQQQVALAEQALEATQRTLLAEIEGGFASAQGHVEAWRAAEAAAASAREAAAMLARAHALGEADLQQLLLAQRQQAEAEAAALEARLLAQQARYALLVDGHYLWDLAHDE